MYVTNSAHQGPSTLNAVGTMLLASATREGAIRLTRLGVVLPASLFLSSQSHSVSSRPRFSQLRLSRPLPPTQPPSSAPASPQPPGCPRSSRGAEARRRKPTASAEWSLGSATLVVSLLLGLRQCCHWAFRTKSEPSSAPAVGPRLTLHPSSLFSVFSLLLYVTDSNLGDRSLPHGLVQRGAA